MSSDRIPVDQELKKAFQELHQKKIDSSQKVEMASRQIEGLKRSVLHKKITDKEIQGLPQGTKVYQGVGRCFIVSTIPEIRETLTKNVSELEDKIRVLDQSKEFIVKDLKSTETQLREMILSKKNAL